MLSLRDKESKSVSREQEGGNVKCVSRQNDEIKCKGQGA